MLDELRILDPSVSWKLGNTSSQKNTHSDMDDSHITGPEDLWPEQDLPAGEETLWKTKSPSQRARDSARLQKWQEMRVGTAKHPSNVLLYTRRLCTPRPTQDDRSRPFDNAYGHTESLMYDNRSTSGKSPL